MENCNFCNESRLNVGEKTEYGSVIIYKIGNEKNGWFATLSPKTGGDIEKDFCIQLMPNAHLKYFSDIENDKELVLNYGIAFAKLNKATGEIIKKENKEINKIPIGFYGKCKHEDEHIHFKIFPYRGNIGQPFTVDSSFEKKEVYKENNEEFVKMKPIKKKYIDSKRFEELTKELINLLNNMKSIDLHIHSRASDGDLNPKELVDLAVKKGMKAIAITDHDTLSGLGEAIDYGKDKGIIIVPGIELGCDELELGLSDIHIVGLFIDYKNKELIEMINWLKEARIIQKKKILDKLKDLGYEISFEELAKEVGDSFGRPHIAKILIRKYNLVWEDIFDRLLGSKGRAFVLQEKPTIAEAIQVIKNAGGIAILAHPGIYLQDSEKILKEFIKHGGDGIEVNYPYSNINEIDKKTEDELINKFKKIADEKRLLISGGSDFHGHIRPVEIGMQGIDEEEFEEMEYYLGKRRN